MYPYLKNKFNEFVNCKVTKLKNMALWRIITIALVASIIVEAKLNQHQREESTTDSICDSEYNNTSKVACYCVKDSHDPKLFKYADCNLLSNGFTADDDVWNKFEVLKNANKLTLTNTRGITLKYIPTKAFKQTTDLLKLEIKYGNIEKIDAFAFANMSLIEEITLTDNQIKTLATHAFANHLVVKTITLDKNEIVEINRNVFIDLPSLEKLFLTANKITTIHDGAFVHLINLRELEIDRNSLFSLNNETFSGLKKLQKLDLSGNSLEVIGDNTFLPLTNLQTLNLEGNRIQMLDERAFNGLTKLLSLSLSRNKLVDIDNVKVFEGLQALISLSLKGNQIRELKNEVIKPILKNFYGNTSNLDVEDNNFPCDCRLDWFTTLINKTLNQHMKIAFENLKCLPDANLREALTNTEEADKTAGQVFENDETIVPNNDYEYYDDTQLNGKLFYSDVRDLLNCSSSEQSAVAAVKKQESTIVKSNKVTTTKAGPRPTFTTPIAISTTEYVKSTISNHGLLDLSLEETTVKIPKTRNVSNNAFNNNDIEGNESFTTTRLATVSAKPIERKNLYNDLDMSSDEAKPDKIKAHRSIQDDIKDTPKYNINNSAHTNVACISMLTSLILCIRLFFY